LKWTVPDLAALRTVSRAGVGRVFKVPLVTHDSVLQRCSVGLPIFLTLKINLLDLCLRCASFGE
jgi:hypothetical protein